MAQNFVKNKNELKENWNTLLQFKEGQVSKLDLETALDTVLPHFQESGLPTSAIDSIIDILSNLSTDDDDSDLCVKVLYILIPNEPLTEALTNNLLQWFEKAYRNNCCSANYFTFWLLVSLKADVISKEFLRSAHYQTLFHLLLDNPKDDALSFCLNELTQPHHVTKMSLTRIISCYQSFATQRKYLSVLLKKYFQIKPNSAAALKIKKLAESPTLKLKDKIMNKSLQSILLLHFMDKSLNDTLNIEEFEEVSSYFNMKPEYADDNGIKVTSLTNFKDIIRHYDTLNTPSNIISLIGYKCGQLYVSLSSISLQNQLEEQVSTVLRGLLNHRLHSGIDYNFFLKALAETQTICCHGMPSVSEFLTRYLISWDGCKFKDGIIGLIQWFYFSNMKDLKTFMRNLFQVYITMTLENKIKVLDTFPDLYLNLWMYLLVQKNVPFVGNPPSWVDSNFSEVLQCVTTYFKTFVYAGLVIHRSGPAFVTGVLNLYYKIFLIEKKFEFSIFTIMPQVVVFMSQTSSCVSVLNLLCKILTMYVNDIEKIAPQTSEFEVFNIIRSYSLDTVRMLLNGMDGNDLGTFVLSQLFSKSDIEKFCSDFAGTKNLMSVPKHFATSYILHELANKLKIKFNDIKPNNFVDLLEHIAPDCTALIRESANFSQTMME